MFEDPDEEIPWWSRCDVEVRGTCTHCGDVLGVPWYFSYPMGRKRYSLCEKCWARREKKPE